MSKTLKDSNKYFRDYYAKNRVKLLTNRGTYGKPKGAKKVNPFIRFWAKVEKTESCWIWHGSKSHNGYGQFQAIRGQGGRAHRWIYEQLHGAIPEGMQLDHLCRVRNCVNPEHLEIVTPRENTLRGNTITAANAVKTHCIRGHEFTPNNTYHPPKRPNRRYCRTCIKQKNK